MSLYEQMLYTEMALNNRGYSLMEIAQLLNVFSNGAIDLDQAIDIIYSMENNGNVFSDLVSTNGKQYIQVWYVYE